MAVSYKDIDELTLKSVLSGTEKIPVSDTQYATPQEIVIGGASKTTLIPDSTTSGKIKQTNGSDNTNSSFSYNTYAITPGKTYLFSGRFGSTVSANNKFVIWLDKDGSVVSYEQYGANEQSTVTYTDKAVVAPDGATYMVLNIQNYYSSYAAVKAVGDISPTKTSDLINDSGFARITISSSEPTSADGDDGDIWIVI